MASEPVSPRRVPKGGDSVVCPNCGTPMDNAYCPACGQRRMDRKDYAFSAYVRKVAAETLGLDSKVLRSLLPLLLRPGYLTKEYLNGRQRRYVKPLTLFFAINILFFLIGYRLGLLHWTYSGTSRGWHGAVAERLVEDHLARGTESKAQFVERFDRELAEQQRSMFLFLIPAFAIVFPVLFRRSGRYIGEHLVYSVHFFAYLLAFSMIGLPFLLLILTGLDLVSGMELGNYFGRDPGLGYLIFLGIGIYHVVAIRRVYDERRLWSFVKAVVLTVWFVVLFFRILQAVLFFTVFYAL